MSIKNRLVKNYKQLKKWASSNNVEAFRLYDQDIPDYPFTIDYYKDHFVVYHLAKDFDLEGDKATHLDETYNALKEMFEITDDHIFYKKRFKRSGLEQYKKLENTKSSITVKEGPAVIEVNLKDYLDTGLFLDHRPIREKLRKESNGLRLLNLFSYTCVVALQAALGGAHTTNIDLSKTYLEWGKRNYSLSGLNPQDHLFLNLDIIKFLDSHKEKYDIIFLDPPTFSNSKNMDQHFEVEKDQNFLINKCMELLSENGTLYFSNNKTDFKMNSELNEKFLVKDITFWSIPKDYRNKKIHQLYSIKQHS